MKFITSYYIATVQAHSNIQNTFH